MSKSSVAQHRAASLMALTSLLAILQRGYRAAADRAVAHVGLSQAMAWPLVMVSRKGDGIRAGTLADLLAIEAASLVRPLEQLADAGLIERREEASDRRAKGLYLTPAGQEACTKIEKALHELRAELFDGVADEDLAACLRVLSGLEARVGKGAASA